MKIRVVAVALLFLFSLFGETGGFSQAQKASKEKPGSISGRVTLQGEPIANLELVLVPDNFYYIKTGKRTVRTDSEGRYQITDVPSNRYSLKVTATEYALAKETMDGRVERAIPVADGEAVEDANLELVQGATIAGRIVNAEGKPVTGIFVGIYPVRDKQIYRGSIYLEGQILKTNERGEFRIHGIPPGTYMVGVGQDISRLTGVVRHRYDHMPTGRVNDNLYYAEVFYGEIDLKAGSELSGIDVALGTPLQSYVVSGRVVDAETGAPIPRCKLSVRHRFPSGGSGGGNLIFEEEVTDENGVFRMAGFIPGAFFLQGKFPEEANYFTNIVDFEINNSDISDLEVRAFRGLTIGGSVVVEGIEDANRANILAKLSGLFITALERRRSDPVRSQNADESFIFRQAPVDADGKFLVNGLRSSYFELLLSNAASKYFSPLRLEVPDPQDDKKVRVIPLTSGSEGVYLTGASLSGSRLIVGYKNAILKTSVKVINGKLPQLSAWISKLRFGATADFDANGVFIYDGLEPGEWQVRIVDSRTHYMEEKTVTLTNDVVTEVKFVIDLSKVKRKKWNLVLR